MVLLSGVGGIGLRVLANRYDNAVIKELLLDPASRQDPHDISGPLNYLLVGSDERVNATPGADQRSDTIMIAHLPAGLDRAYLISVPRDLLVEIPPSPATGWPGGPDKINAAFQYGGGGQGGTQLLSATLTQLTGLRFDGAALVNFAGFQQAIDLLGGVRMCVDAEVRSIHTQSVFTPGCHQMTGAQALDFARQRYGLPNGDFDRQRHQQQLLRAMMDKATAADMLRNPIRLDQVIRAIGSSFVVDTNGVPLEDLIFGMRRIRADALQGIQLPSHAETIDEVSYVLMDEPANDLFTSVQNADLDSWARANPKWVSRL